MAIVSRVGSDFGERQLAIEIGTSIPSARVIRVLDDLMRLYGRPARVRVDNGRELTAEAFVEWCTAYRIAIGYIQPGKPDQNAFIERFNRSYREEVLDAHLFDTLDQVREIADAWLETYNTERPHASLGQVPPLTFSRPIDPVVLQRIIDYASRLNAESRYFFALVSDLTTIIDVGDLLRIDRNPGGGSKWTLIEVKEGRANAVISEIIQDPKTAEDEQMRQVRGQFGEHGVRQARRMIRQQLRLQEVDKILTKDTGIDLVTKREIFLSREVFQAEDYVRALHHVIKAARQKGIGLSAVDSCLRIAAIRADELGRNTTITGVAHLFYHWDNPAAACALPDKKGFIAEVETASSRPFVDLLAHSMIVRWSYPAFIWMLEPEELFDVVMGRVMIFAQFDIQEFVGRIGALGFKTSWVTGKQSADMKPFRGPIPGSPNAWALRVEAGDLRMDYLVGFFGRLFTELMTPGDLLRLVRAAIDCAPRP
jgi:putative transposase